MYFTTIGIIIIKIPENQENETAFLESEVPTLHRRNEKSCNFPGLFFPEWLDASGFLSLGTIDVLDWIAVSFEGCLVHYRVLAGSWPLPTRYQ